MSYQFEKTGAIKAMTAEEMAEADRDSAIITHHTGILENGVPYWVFIAVKPSEYQTFLQVTTERRPFRFGDYGVILKCGFEKEIPCNVKDEMKQQYGYEDDYMEKLKNQVYEAQLAFLREQENDRIASIVNMLKKT